MKFNFEKHVPAPKQEELKENVEKTQEEFDTEIIKEAEKLGTNVEKLKAEIDAFGGEEKFKKIFSEKEGGFSSKGDGEMMAQTKGDKFIENHLGWASSDRESSNQTSKFSAIFATLAVVMEAFMIYDGNGQAPFGVGITAVSGLASVFTGISAIKEKISAKKYEKEAKKMDLKMKMTDTPKEITN